ncbi:MAG TPA: ABC transporter substrate-binding protein [Ignisphaera sp.]|nr:ABC transporter substrate-binding protein [Ignisphaera sp.]
MNRGISKLVLAIVIVLVIVVAIAAIMLTRAPPQRTTPTTVASTTPSPSPKTSPSPTPTKSPSPTRSPSLSPSPTPVKCETLTLGQPDMEPTILDPHRFYDSESGRVIRLVYEKLVDYEGSSVEKIVGVLAERWEVSNDGKVWTFYLRKGVKFHDGTSFNSTAVVVSWNRFMYIYNTTGEGAGWLFADIVDKVEAVDTYTVKFVLKQPVPDFLARMAALWGFYVVSPTCIEKHKTADDPWATKWLHEHECGTGPYVLKEWKHHQYIILEKFDDYWRGWKDKPAGYICKVVIKEITETATLKLALLKGEIDMVLGGTTYEDIPVFKKRKDIVVYENPSFNVLYVFFNTKKPPLDNLKVRQALSYAVNYEEMVKVVLLGHGKPMKGPLPSSMPGWDPNVPMYTYDLDKAVSLLKEAGLEGKEVKLVYAYVQGDETERKVGELLKRYFEALGEKAGVKITVELQPMTWDTLYNLVMGGEPENAPDMAALYWWPDYVDPVDYFFPMFHSEGSYNFAHLSDSKLDEMIDKASVELDKAKRAELIKEIQKRIVELAPAVFCFELDQIDVARANVHGYVYNPLFILTVNAYDMWKS